MGAAKRNTGGSQSLKKIDERQYTEVENMP